MTMSSFALSPSRALDFVSCPLKFRYRAIDKLPDPPSEAALRGTLVHAVLEQMYKQAPEGRTQEHAFSLLGPEWEKLSQEEYARQVVPTEAAEQELLEVSRSLLQSYFRIENPQLLAPAAMEQFIRTKIGNLNVCGFIDRVDLSPTGQVRIVDYKTGKSPSVRFQDDKIFQMLFYAMMWQSDRGALPARLQLIFLKDGKVLTIDPTPQQVEQMQERVLGIWNQIETAARQHAFRPRRSPLCRWCAFKDYCPAFGGTEPPQAEDATAHLLSAAD